MAGAARSSVAAGFVPNGASVALFMPGAIILADTFVAGVGSVLVGAGTIRGGLAVEPGAAPSL